MNTPEERRAANDKRVAEDISQYGCHVISVSDPSGKELSFSYSVGIQESCGAPEIIVVGLPSKVGGSVVNEYNRKVRAGAQFEPGVLYPGFLAGFSVYIEPVALEALTDYTLGCKRYYRGRLYSASQLIYPNTSGVWPWQEQADSWFKINQPMLGRARLGEK